ncbi:MAG TPA: four helix bundle protein [Gemmatimonadaceae bacterium]|nr:four helix bundle protein [Gemmatimonadaceae bacterium]
MAAPPDVAEPSFSADARDRVPEHIRRDALWTSRAYRAALLAADECWRDLEPIRRSAGTRPVADQLYRAVCSVGANIAEGYGRRSGPDRTRFCEFALGSAREARHWYYVARHALGATTLEARLALLTNIIRLLLGIIQSERHQRR